jgi:hypothetical protein
MRSSASAAASRSLPERPESISIEPARRTPIDSSLNVRATARVDRRIAMSSCRAVDSATAPCIALVGAWTPTAPRSIAPAGRAQARCGSACAGTFRSRAPRAACGAPSSGACSSAFSIAATRTRASRASAAAAAATTCCSRSPARRATSARAATRSGCLPGANGSSNSCCGPWRIGSTSSPYRS